MARIETARYDCGEMRIIVNAFSEQFDWVPGHKHKYDHMTYVVRGRIFVFALTPKGRKYQREYGPGQRFLIPAEVEHTIVFLDITGGEFHCIFPRHLEPGKSSIKDTGWDDLQLLVPEGQIAAFTGERHGFDPETSVLRA